MPHALLPPEQHQHARKVPPLRRTMTSMCSQSAPSFTMLAHSSARRAKSAERIDGDITVVGRSRTRVAGIVGGCCSARSAALFAARDAPRGSRTRVAGIVGGCWRVIGHNERVGEVFGEVAALLV